MLRGEDSAATDHKGFELIHLSQEGGDGCERLRVSSAKARVIFIVASCEGVCSVYMFTQVGSKYLGISPSGEL